MRDMATSLRGIFVSDVLTSRTMPRHLYKTVKNILTKLIDIGCLSAQNSFCESAYGARHAHFGIFRVENVPNKTVDLRLSGAVLPHCINEHCRPVDGNDTKLDSAKL